MDGSSWRETPGHTSIVLHTSQTPSPNLAPHLNLEGPGVSVGLDQIVAPLVQVVHISNELRWHLKVAKYVKGRKG